MQRLWEEERAAGSDVLRVETLERLGGAQRIVEEHLEGAMGELTDAQKDVAARLFNHLVTPSGTKIAHELSDLADFGSVSVDELRPVLETLAERRILRSVEEGGGVRYEIFHDVLAEPVLAWRTAHEADRELAPSEDGVRPEAPAPARGDRGRQRAPRAMAGVTAYALSQRTEAREQAREARAHQLEAESAAGLPFDPERSVLLAREAARLHPSETAEEALRTALIQSRVRTVVDVGEPLLGAVLNGDDVLAATASGSLVVADGSTGATSSTFATGAPARQVSFAENGVALFTGKDGVLRVAQATGEVRPIPGVEEVDGAEISPDGTLAVLVGREGARLIDVKTGTVERTFPHRGAVSAAISRDNRRVATGAADDTVRLWARTGARIRTLVGHKGHPTALTFGPSAASLASASTDGVARIWQAGDGRLTVALEGDATALTDVGFSTDGAHTVTSSRDGTVRVSNAEAGVTLLAFNGHRELVTSAAFTGPAGSSVVTASADGTARVWDALFQPELEELARLPSRIESVDAEDGRLRVTTVDGRVHLLDPDTGEQLGVVDGVRSDGLVRGPDGATAEIRKNTVVLRAERDGGRCSRVIEIVCGRRSSLLTERCSRRPAATTTSGSGTGRRAKGSDRCSTTPRSATRASARTAAGWCRRRSGRRSGIRGPA